MCRKVYSKPNFAIKSHCINQGIIQKINVDEFENLLNDFVFSQNISMILDQITMAGFNKSF